MPTYTKSQPKPLRRKKSLLFAAIALLVLVGGGAAVYLVRKNDTHNVSRPTSSTTGQQKPETINYTPATPEETKDSDAAKDRISDSKQTPPPSPGNTTTTVVLTPLITNAALADGQVEVSSYVQGVVEDGGTCTLKAANGTQTITRTESGIANASNTVCPTFSIEKSAFIPAGSWTITVSYKSDRGSGTSKASTLEVK